MCILELIAKLPNGYCMKTQTTVQRKFIPITGADLQGIISIVQYFMGTKLHRRQCFV